jgi:hypothetical protein
VECRLAPLSCWDPQISQVYADWEITRRRGTGERGGITEICAICGLILGPALRLKSAVRLWTG